MNANAVRHIGQGPLYELRVRALTGEHKVLEIWQIPCRATPGVKKPECKAALKGRVFRIVETRVRRRLKAGGIILRGLEKGESRAYAVDEDMALNLSLLFRALAPMRNIDRIRRVAQGIDEMTREESGYWLGMAVHRKKPRRVLAALRTLLTST